MRVLKSDFAKYNISDDEEMDDIRKLSQIYLYLVSLLKNIL